MIKLKNLVSDYMSDHRTIKVSCYEFDWNNESVKKIDHWNIPVECYMDIIITPIPLPKWVIRFAAKWERLPKLLRFIPVWII